MAGAQQYIVDSMIEHSVNLLRVDAGMRRDVMQLLDQMSRELVDKLMTEDLTNYSKARTQALLNGAQRIIQQYYDRSAEITADSLDGVGRAEADHISGMLTDALDTDIGVVLPSARYFESMVTNTLISGAPNASWWARQGQDTAFRFSNAVRQGLANGETNMQIVRRVMGAPGVPGVLGLSRANAASLVQTAVQSVANDARMQTFKKNDHVVKGVEQISTLDGHTTRICVAYSGGKWDLDGNPIDGTTLPFRNPGGSSNGTPRHWSCRSVLVPITKTFRELGIDIDEPARGTRASMDGQIAADTSFDSFLKKKTAEFQNELLGKGRADLWRDGKITLQQLLDQSGNPLSVAELRRRYDRKGKGK